MQSSELLKRIASSRATLFVALFNSLQVESKMRHGLINQVYEHLHIHAEVWGAVHKADGQGEVETHDLILCRVQLGEK